MKDNEIILFAALAVGAAIYMKQARAAAAPATRPGYPPAASQTQNVNGAMWTSLLGNAWTSLVNPATGGSLFGKNGLGQLVTSDGKPVSSEMQALLPNVLGDGYTPSVNYGDTPNYIDDAFPALAGLEWQ
jgi:hypothetical protein